MQQENSNKARWMLYLVIMVLVSWTFWRSNDSELNTIINDERTYAQSWRSPNNEELVVIGRIMVANNVISCGEYHVKEITTKEYVIACTQDGRDWTYYVAFSAIDKIYLANDEMVAKLKPPY